MSNEKATIEKQETLPKTAAADPDATFPGAEKPLAVVALEIDENDHVGGDPYNHTGSFCVPEFSDE